jgi:hypothetical protein
MHFLARWMARPHNVPTVIAYLMTKHFAERDLHALRVVRTGGRRGGPP